MAIAGYSVFTSSTQANILDSFPPDSLLINLSRLFFGANMFLTFPIECFVCREVIYEVMYANERRNQSEDLHRRASMQMHVGITSALVFSSMFIALATCDLGFVLELTGGFAATVLAFILPAACYIKLTSGPWNDPKKYYSIFTVGFGGMVMVLSTWLSLVKFFTSDSIVKC